jgi:hypothetical protein
VWLRHEPQKVTRKAALPESETHIWLQSPSASKGLGFWDLLAHIVEQPVPVPPPGPAVSPQLADFLTQALTKARGRWLQGLGSCSPTQCLH